MSWWPFSGSKKPIYQDRDALEELTRVAEETAKKKRAEKEARDAELEKQKAYADRQKKIEEFWRNDIEKEKEKERAKLSKEIDADFAPAFELLNRLKDPRQPFKPFK